MNHDRDIRRAEAFGRLAARDGCGYQSCPYEADGGPDERQLAARWVRAFVGAGGRVGVEDQDQEDDMPEGEIAARGGAKKWRTVTRPGGKTVKVAVVRKKGKRGGSTVAGPVHEKEK